MMIEKKNNTKTDQAWGLLYNRLERDGLLVDEKSAKRPLWRQTSLQWAACVAFLCIGAFAVTVFVGKRGAESELLSLYNHENAATLVTTFDDGSVAYLGEQTSLRYPKQFQKDKREVFLQGNALFNVTGNKQRPFIVETEQVKIEVLGTVFNVKSMDAFSLSVERGEVRVTSKSSGQNTLVQTGETVSLRDGLLKTSLTKDEQQFQNYTKRMQFKDERLEDVIRLINQNSDRKSVV